MASPVTTFRVRSFCVFFFHCSSSTCRMKWICSWERPSFVGSILVATRALDSFGVFSAMPAVSEAWKVVPQRTVFQMIYRVGGAVSSASVCCEICAQRAPPSCMRMKRNCATFKWAPIAIKVPTRRRSHLSWGEIRGNSAIFRKIRRYSGLYWGFLFISDKNTIILIYLVVLNVKFVIRADSQSCHFKWRGNSFVLQATV